MEQPPPSETPVAKSLTHFLHVGKTGGMAIKYALRPLSTHGRYQINFCKHGFRLKNIPFGQGAICFLRDPVSRFVSGFYSRQRKGRPMMFFPWTPGERLAFGQFATPNQLALALSSQDELQGTRARKAMRRIVHVNMPYRYWFGSNDDFLSRLSDILFVGFQETLAEDFERLKQILALPAEARLPDDEVQAHKNPAQLDRRLDEQAVQNLRQWYRADYEFIALCRKHLPPERLGKGIDYWVAEQNPTV